MAEEFDLDSIMKMNTEFEMFVVWRVNNVTLEELDENSDIVKEYKKSAGRCSAYAYTGPTSTFAGQTFDDGVLEYLYGKYEKIIKIDNLPEEHGKQITIYTHGHWLGYAGMNGFGLSVTWLYIDSGDRDLEKGVPTVSIIRELLTMATIKQAVDFLKSIPHAVPNGFVIAHPHDGVVVAECLPKSQGTYVYHPHKSNEFTVHTNNILHDKEHLSKEMERSTSSRERHRRITAAATAKPVLIEDLKRLFTEDYEKEKEYSS